MEISQSRRTKICREGWYYLVVLGCVVGGALLRDVNLLLLVAGMLAGPILWSWPAVVTTLRGLAPRRKMPQGVCAGDLLVVGFELANPRRWLGSWAVEVQEHVTGPDGHMAPPAVFFPYVRAGQTRKAYYRGRLVRRGQYQFGPLTLSTRFPFGLLRCSVEVQASDTLVVFPHLGRLTRQWITRHREAFEGSAVRQGKHSRMEGEFFGVRGWQAGDSRRWVHWRSSVRRGTLIVRQFEQPRNRDVALLVDMWQPPQPDAQQTDNVELAVSFAATVLTDLCRKGGSNILLGTTGVHPQCRGGPASVALLRDAMAQLALAEACQHDGLADLLTQVLEQIEPGAEVILLSPRPVDMEDRQRFGALWADPARRAGLRRIRTIHTGVDPSGRCELSQYFDPE